MRRALAAIGAVMLVIGGVWFLQGIGMLPGSMMSGQQFWAYAGGVLFVGGAVVGWLGLRKS